MNKVEYWVDTANYDLDTAEAMYQTKRWLYVGFLCHQVIEKMIKGYHVNFKQEMPPRIQVFIDYRQIVDCMVLFPKSNKIF